MIGYLYLIKNRVNDKVYVGKTYTNINRRFNQHISDSKRWPNRPLYKAILEIGSENFYIELVGAYPENELEQREIELINRLVQFKKV